MDNLYKPAWQSGSNVHEKNWVGALLATRKQYLTLLIAANGLPFSSKAWAKNLKFRYSSKSVFNAVQYLIIAIEEIHHNIKLFEMLQKDEGSELNIEYLEKI